MDPKVCMRCEPTDWCLLLALVHAAEQYLGFFIASIALHRRKLHNRMLLSASRSVLLLQLARRRKRCVDCVLFN